MKNKDLMLIACSALASATLAVALFSGGPTIAADDNQPRKIQPKFTAHNVEMTVEPRDARVFQAGDIPEFTIRAVNTSKESVEFPVELTLAKTSPRDTFSRLPLMPTEIWKGPLSIALGPNETKTFNIAAQTSLATQTFYSVRLREPMPAPIAANAVQNAVVAAPISLFTQTTLLDFSIFTNVPVAQAKLTAAK